MPSALSQQQFEGMPKAMTSLPVVERDVFHDAEKHEPHELNQREFKEHPDTWYHGTLTRPGTPDDRTSWRLSGQFSPQDDSIHLGTRKAALERAGESHHNPLWSKRLGYPGWGETDEVESVHQVLPPRVEAYRYVGNKPIGQTKDPYDQDWPTKSLPEGPMEAKAYRNELEDIGSTSLVVGSRNAIKTHEDFLVEHRRAGKEIPARALEGYDQIPGQMDLFRDRRYKNRRQLGIF